MIFELSRFSDLALLLMRLAIAAIFIYHGMPKIKNAKAMSQSMAMPAGMIMMLGLVELIASLGLIFGIYLQISAALLALVMIGALYFKIAKWHAPFAAHDKTGWEFDLILLSANLVLLVSGGGAISVQ